MKKRLWQAVLALFVIAALPACRQKSVGPPADPMARAYDVEPDWNEPQKLIALNYKQAQGKRIFYDVASGATPTPLPPDRPTGAT